MKVNKVCLVGHDVQPSKAFELLRPELVSRGVEVVLSTSHGKDLPQEPNGEIKDSSFVLIGMSSSPVWAEGEIQVAQIAVENNVRFGFYSDTFYAYRRGWFEPFRNKASLLFVLNAAEVDDARNFFPHAEIVPSGNPTHATYFERIIPPDEVERRLGCGKDDFLVFVSGTKYQKITDALIEATVYACRAISGVRIVVGMHPGDQTPLDQYRQKISDLGFPVMLTTKGTISGSEVLSRANLLVESFGSLSIEASCKRIPVISLISEPVEELLSKEIGQREWPPCVQGTSILARNKEELKMAVEREDYADLIKRQTELYPKPTRGKSGSVCVMAESIQRLISGQE